VAEEVAPRAAAARPPNATGAARGAEAALFRLLNRFAEPAIRSGVAFPPFAPGGLLVLETRGRTSGRTYRVHLAALRLGCHVLVSTFRGRRSEWPRNLAADRAPRLWLHGRARPVHARVFAPGVRASRRPLPRELRWLPALLAPYKRAGWAFAVLSTRREG
jgi:F420H(2)-dependent quinone reductase